MEIELQRAGAAERELMHSAEQAFSNADFEKARQAVDKLDQSCSCDEVQLFTIHLRFRLDALTGHRRSVEDTLTMLELLRARLSILGPWPLHWYIQAWFTAPSLAERRVDPVYLYHLTEALPSVVLRQDCLVLAIDYAVAYSEHHFIARLEADSPFDMTWLAAPFHRAMIDGLFAAYRRDKGALRVATNGLRQTAGTPLEKLETERFSNRFAHLLS